MHYHRLPQAILFASLAMFASLRVLAGELNDTGVMHCTDGVTLGLPCASEVDQTALLPGQDAEHGRDFLETDPTDGRGGFSFTKLDVDGVALADQQADYTNTPWACVRDEVTGLVWEVKTDDGGLMDRDWTYSWYSSAGVGDGGFAGTENRGSCADAANCDTEKFAAEVNASALCGFSDWRLPDWSELHSILVYPDGPTVFPLVPLVDSDYFPNALPVSHWTGTSSVLVGTSARVLLFGAGGGLSELKSSPLSVRLVREEVR